MVGVSVNVWNAKRRFLERGHRGGDTSDASLIRILNQSLGSSVMLNL